MFSRKTSSIEIFPLLATVGLLAGLERTSLADPACDDNNGNSPYVCVDKSGTPPQAIFDFNFDFADPDNPGVTFLTGNDAWVVWSQVSDTNTTPANLGDIKIDATVLTDSFTVKIVNDNTGGAGAVDVGSLVLDDTNPFFAGNSAISGGEIADDLLGDLMVVRDGSGGGGTISLTIGDGLLGDVSVSVVNSLLVGGSSTGTIRLGEIAPGGLMRFGSGTALCPTGLTVSGPVRMTKIGSGASFIIGGDLTADLTVADKIEGGLLRVDGNVASTTKITIGDMVSAGSNHSSALLAWQNEPPVGSGCLQFEGDLDLQSGVKANQSVHIPSPLTSGASIDLNGQDVAGALSVSRGGSGAISNGGVVTSTGSVLLAAGIEDFLGTATFAGVDPGGEIWIATGSDLGGTISVTGDMDGEINLGVVSGSLGPSRLLPAGRILVGNDCTGDVLVAGDSWGDVSIDGDAASTSSIHVAESLKGRILIDGLSDADIAVGHDTGRVSLVHLEGGFGAEGSVAVNTNGMTLGAGINNANGDIRVGPVTSVCCPPPPITYDGCIHVLVGLAGGGDLNGDIDVLGCHNPGDLAICADGFINGSITIAQDSCPNQVGYDCIAPCPAP